MLVNPDKVRKMHREQSTHYNTKIRVGKIADKLISSYARELDYDIRTLWEFAFCPISSGIGVRGYIGDIVLFFINSKTHQIERMLII